MERIGGSGWNHSPSLSDESDAESRGGPDGLGSRTQARGSVPTWPRGIACAILSAVRTIRYTRTAERQLARLAPIVAAGIEAKIVQYATAPATLAANVKLLSDGVTRRLRVGDHRVLMDETGVVLDILAVGHRSDIYR